VCAYLGGFRSCHESVDGLRSFVNNPHTSTEIFVVGRSGRSTMMEQRSLNMSN